MRKTITVLLVPSTLLILFITCKHTDKRAIVSPVLISKYARPLRNIHFTSSPARLERGRYLANGILRCFHCHAPVDTTRPGRPPFPDQLGGGQLFYKSDSTHLYAPNISPDIETGAGSWTDDMFVRAFRSGIGHDGRALTNMPWWVFQKLSDEELASVIVYLRSLPPVKNKLPERLLKRGREKELQNEPRPMENISVAEPDTSTFLAKGKYLVSIGECEGCHTAWYIRNPGYFGGGNIIANRKTDSVVASSNISSDITGIGGWDDKTFINVIRTGKGGMLHWTMPWIAFRNISDTDLSAMLAALKTLPPVKHQIVNGKKPTLCAVCGSLHGFGDQNKIIPIIPIAMNPKLYFAYAGVYADSEKDTVIILSKDHKLLIKMGGEDDKGIELIPVAKNEFHGSGLPSPITFITNSDGKLTGFRDHDLVPMTFMKTHGVQ